MFRYTNILISTIVASKIFLNHSEASRGVLKRGCTVYNCINTAVSACLQRVSHCTMGLWGGGGDCRDRLYSLE